MAFFSSKWTVLCALRRIGWALKGHLWWLAHRAKSGWGGWLLLALLAFVVLGVAENPPEETLPVLPVVAQKETPPVWLVFIDSLSDRVAHDPAVMPGLAALREEGASLTVEPCRDRLTYRCLHAVFSGADASSLLSLRANFDHRPSREGTLLHLAAAQRRVVGLGAHDLEAYGSAFHDSWYFPSPEVPEAQVLEQVRKHRDAGLLVLGFSQGDRAAHAYGPGSKPYIEAFRETDRIVSELRKEMPPGAHLVVFGDHGHDAAGHHLPGGEATTVAFYQGPAVRPGGTGKMQITDHRVLLGLLLGLPSPAIFQGPALDTIFEPRWLHEHLGSLPELRGKTAPLLGPFARLGVLGLLVLALGAAGWRWVLLFPLQTRERVLGMGVIFIALRVAGGLAYEPLCQRIHDHGDAPWRSAFLLLPLGGGLLAGRWLLRGRWGGGAALGLLVPFFLLFPSANYYGSGRAIVYGAMLALGMTALWIWRRAPAARRRLPLVALAPLALVLFLDVRRVGAVAGAQGYFELNSSLLRDHAPLLLILGKLLGGLLLGRVLSPSLGTRWARWALVCSALLGLLGGGTWRLPPEIVLLAPILLLAGRSGRAPAFAVLWISMESIYSVPTAAAMGWLVIGSLGVLAALRGTEIERGGVVGVLVALVGGYLALWPVAGMRLAGLDFSLMFRWIAPERYEQFWWVIGLGLAIKLILPVTLPGLLVALSGGKVQVALSLMELKALSLACFASAWAVVGPVTALPGQEALSELGVLLLVGVGLWGVAAVRGLWRGAFGSRKAKPVVV